MTMTEPMRDPNPFHHASMLVRKMDAVDLRALKSLIAEREKELASSNVTFLKSRLTLRWTVSPMSGVLVARGKDCTYRIMPFKNEHGEAKFMLSAQWHDDSTMTHLRTYGDHDALKYDAEAHNFGRPK